MDNELGEYVVHERVTLDVMTTAETAVSGSFPSRLDADCNHGYQSEGDRCWQGSRVQSQQ